MRISGILILKRGGDDIMTCFFCKGDMRRSLTNHFVTLGKCMIIVKNVPCTKCEQCGEVVYDDEIAMKLEEIIKAIQPLTEVAIVDYSNKVA